MTLSAEIDPVQVRHSLALSRAQGMTFETAWRDAIGKRRHSDAGVLKFMRKHFRAAYYNLATGSGRCFVPAPDTSGAAVTIGSTCRNPERDAAIITAVNAGQTCDEVAAEIGISIERVRAITRDARSRASMSVVRPSRSERCRSGDDCDRLATCGRFRPMWCDHHGVELELLTARLGLDLDAANPRNGGNASLFTQRAAA